MRAPAFFVIARGFGPVAIHAVSFGKILFSFVPRGKISPLPKKGRGQKINAPPLVQGGEGNGWMLHLPSSQMAEQAVRMVHK
jgi:hypothetical protein